MLPRVSPSPYMCLQQPCASPELAVAARSLPPAQPANSAPAVVGAHPEAAQPQAGPPVTKAASADAVVERSTTPQSTGHAPSLVSFPV